jgi:negative regulator of flagellin synthesis FlgM
LSHTNGIANPQDPFTTETTAPSAGAAKTERTESVSIAVTPHSPAANAMPLDDAKWSTFGGALAHALTQSDVRMDKVTALQQAIAAGTYNVSASDVAGKIINSLLN